MTFPLHSMVCFVHCVANIFLPIEGEKNSHKDIFFFIPESMDWKEEKNQYLPSKHFLLSKTSWRCPKDIFSVTTVGLTRRLQDVFAKCLLKTSSRCLSSTSWRYDVFAWRLQDYLQDVSKTSSIRLHQGEFLLGKFICHLTINHSANLKCQFPQIW